MLVNQQSEAESYFWRSEKRIGGDENQNILNFFLFRVAAAIDTLNMELKL